MKHSVYISWAKRHAAARYNLANSGILPCGRSDLPVTLDDVALNGPHQEDREPLGEAIAAHFGTRPERVVTAQGTSMANFLAFATVLERGDEVLVEQPTYEPFLAALAYLGADIRRFARRFEDGYELDVDALRALISPRTKLVVISSPHNPSGVTVNQDALRDAGELAARVGARVLVDEAYRDILFEDAPPISARLGDHFITTGSLTKAYGLGGLRCGWALSEPELAERMRRLNDLCGAMNSVPSDRLALAAFRHLDRLAARSRALIEPNHRLVEAFLAAHAEWLECVLPPRTLIVFPRLRRQASSEPLHDLLRTFDTSIVPGRFFEDPRHFRLGFAVKTEDVAAGLENLSQAVRRLHPPAHSGL
jgi:aspartate/methionine/tyrosine aminotransferase